MNCPYCNNPCNYKFAEWNCKNHPECDVYFQTNSFNNNIYYTFFYKDNENKIVCLNHINNELQIMTITYILYRCPSSFEHITPSNIFDKVKTILTFM